MYDRFNNSFSKAVWHRTSQKRCHKCNTCSIKADSIMLHYRIFKVLTKTPFKQLLIILAKSKNKLTVVLFSISISWFLNLVKLQ